MRPISKENYFFCKDCPALIIDNGGVYCIVDKCIYEDDDNDSTRRKEKV